jgi:hypothetical protein
MISDRLLFDLSFGLGWPRRTVINTYPYVNPCVVTSLPRGSRLYLSHGAMKKAP